VFQNGALRAITLCAALCVSATAAEAAQADARTPAQPPPEPSLTRAILRDKDLGPTVPQMSGHGGELLHAADRANRAAHAPADRAS